MERKVYERKRLGEILSSAVCDVLVEERTLLTIRNRTRDEFTGVCKYHHDTGELESVDLDTYSLEDKYDSYKWKSMRELVVWLDLTEEQSEE